MGKKFKWLSGDRLVEICIFVAMFVLTMLHEWIQINTLMDFIKGLVFFLILYVQAQLHRFFVFPLLLKKSYLLYGLVTFGSLLAGALMAFVVCYWWISPEIYHDGNPLMWVIYSFVICTVSTITIMGLFLTHQYYKDRQRKYQDDLLLSEMNIKLLHAQLNPHFFFNMFNNLYGVSLSEPGRVPELIIKLSGMMRYQLEKGNQPLVKLEDEIKFISNYVDMERERVGRRCEIVFAFSQESEWFNSRHIAPLILITLVENAFKHSLTVTSKWFVHIHIRLHGEVLTVEIANSCPDPSLKNESTAMGLYNTQKRLELLYKGMFTFITNFTDQECRTSLTLQLQNK